MPANSHHEDYDELSLKWERCRHTIGGQDKIREHGTQYLPKLKEQDADDYKGYLTRATFFNATARTIDGLVGMVFRKAPIVTLPTGMDAISQDVDLAGTTLLSFAENIVREVLSVGRFGSLVEYPVVTEQPITLADQARQNQRPYVATYPAESILNWRMERVNNSMQYSLIVLSEEYTESDDGFEQSCKQQLRVLRLDKGVYTQQLYRKNEKEEWVEFGPIIVPLKSGKPLPAIPFYAFGPNANDLSEQDPPLLDLVDLNLAHFRVSADYENGCHFAGMPTLFLAGVTLKDGEKVLLGSRTAIVSDNSQANGQFLEFTGQGMGCLESNLQRKENQMAAIGARMLAPEKAGVEAADTLAMRHSGESAILASVANLASQGLRKLLAFMGEWEGVAGDILFQLNTDYMPQGMGAQDLAELVKSYQTGAISFDTLFNNLQRGEIITADRTVEQEKEAIALDGQGVDTVTGGAGG